MFGLDAAGTPEAMTGLEAALDAPDAGTTSLALDAGAAPPTPDAAPELPEFESPPPPLHPRATTASSTSTNRCGRCERFMCIPLGRTVGAGGRMRAGKHGWVEQ